MTETDRVNLLNWYRQNQRPLPWRKNRDPYRVWISETMLQQTTTEAVKPYYEKFLKRFPTVEDLANSPIESVLEMWAGLGYYSRARNLHKAAQELAEKGFARSYQKLIELPGFGPYTSRAVSSIAFGEEVGVLDGNVIRVLSRKNNLALEWWRPKERDILQKKADEVVAGGPSHELNQALMELGATICTPQNPKCLLCPWLSTCEGQKKQTHTLLPLKKPKAAGETWHWKATVYTRQNRIYLVENTGAPFLKGQWLLPAEAKKVKTAPQKFTFKHGITRYDIYVSIEKKSQISAQHKKQQGRWVELEKLAQISPFSLMTKALESIQIKK